MARWWKGLERVRVVNLQLSGPMVCQNSQRVGEYQGRTVLAAGETPGGDSRDGRPTLKNVG